MDRTASKESHNRGVHMAGVAAFPSKISTAININPHHCVVVVETRFLPLSGFILS
jgi:hypothetical protein